MSETPDIRKLAAEEYNTPVHPGFITGGTFWNGANASGKHDGAKSRPFWNAHATQFMYPPSFEFAAVPACRRFLFTATDCNQQTHTFEADTPMAPLTPIWGEIPEGDVELTVKALEDDGTPIGLVGARIFYRSAPYAGPDAYPPKAKSYRECAIHALRYVYDMPIVRYWHEHGVPHPEYHLNRYPSKMIPALINAMIAYASIAPENAENAIQLAKNAADYLLSITIGGDSPLKGLPPTYHVAFNQGKYDFCDYGEDHVKNMVMMCYPAQVGSVYLALEKVCGDVKYYEAARRIADYYRDTVQENGTWNLMVDIITGEGRSANDLMPESVIPFMKAMYDRTGEEIWLDLMKNAHAYRYSCRMDSYEWEGQFEDSPVSSHYTNLSHYPADAMLYYIVENQKDDPAAIAEAEVLARFIEDQFVIWHKFAPRNRKNLDPWFNQYNNNKAEWHCPAGMEQYNWYVPIDSSTAHIMIAFLRLYKATGNPVHLAKACTLADSITRIQNPRTGMIPTQWYRKSAIEDGGDFWMNCCIEVAVLMMEIANETEKE